MVYLLELANLAALPSNIANDAGWWSETARYDTCVLARIQKEFVGFAYGPQMDRLFRRPGRLDMLWIDMPMRKF
jgi:hypothetical protein